VLLITTNLCAIHCRYCFRRHYPYDEEPKSLAAWQPAIRHIAEDASIHEVILSGGDPLSLSDSRLCALVSAFREIPHLRRLRVHTRLPIVIPARVTNDLIDCLTNCRMAPYLVLHVNHSRELSEGVLHGIARLRQAGIVLLNQAVLLRGVNDTEAALLELCERLSNHGVLPYYLNQLDRVHGAAHFEVSISRGKELIKNLRERLPGYAVPRYVQDEPGVGSKTVLL
jgi:EF-P beta-lysylation protein EpmB